jgi:predicted alpha/beta hydrolase family esterase
MSWWSNLQYGREVLSAYRSPLTAVACSPAPELGARVERWTMVDERGDTFTGLWRTAVRRAMDPRAESEAIDQPWTVVLLGGFFAGERAALLLPERLHAHVLAVDWPWKGPRKLSAIQFVSLLPAIRRTALRSPAALAIGVDAVSRQPEVDTTRIALVGASLGVPSTVAALELTYAPAACALLYGGADIETWMSHALTRYGSPDPLAPVIAKYAVAFVRPLEPALHRTEAKLRMLIVNARCDQFVPLAVAQALHRAFPQATVRWKEGQQHLNGRPGPIIDDLAAEVEAWLEGSPRGREARSYLSVLRRSSRWGAR